MVALVICSACTRAEKEEARADESAVAASATVSSAGSPVSDAPSATSASTAAPSVISEPPLPIVPAGKASILADVGLTIAPPFAYRIEDRKTHWNVEGTSRDAPTFWVMRKTYRPDAALGEVLPCADHKEGTAHREPDGSFTSRCTGSAKDDGVWFARLVPTTSTTYETVQCQGSSKSPAKQKLIEATCRSIKRR